MGLTVLLVCKNTACPSFGRKVRYPLTTGRRICDGCNGQLHGFMRGDWVAPVEAPALTREAPDDAQRRMVPTMPAPRGTHSGREPGELTPQEFAHAILAAVGARPSIDVRQVYTAILAALGARQLVVNRRPAKLQEVRQMAARLAREGKLMIAGDTLGAAG